MKFISTQTEFGLFMMLRSLLLVLLLLPTFAAENIKAVGAVSKANIKAVGAVAEANIKAVGAVDNTGSSFTPNATTFAGDDQCWLERDADLTGNADGKSFTLSFWVDFSGGDFSAQRIIQMEDGRFRLTREGAGNTLRLTCVNTSGTDIVDLETTSTLVAAGGWYHVIFSVDKSVETRRHLYVNGVDRLQVNTFLSDDVDGNTTSIDFTAGDWAIGDFVGGGAGDLTGCLSEFYFSKTYIDLSVAGNRDIFYHADGPPQSLAAVNSPIIYLTSAFGSFHVNSGSGGDFVKKGTTAFTSCTAP